MSRTNAEYRSGAAAPEYTLTRKRMRSIRLRVVPPTGELKVSAPFSTPVSRIDAFVASKQSWIAARRAEIEGMAPRLEHGVQAEACREELEAWLEELLPYWCERFGVEQPHISLRIMRSQWGSCRASTQRITLNLELARRGRDMAEYVLVHELSHLFEMNHGPRFYALMDRHLPDWRERKARLGRL